MPYTLIDTHAHLNFQAFEKDLDSVIKSTLEAGVEKIINVGANLDSSQQAIEIAEKYPSCYASVGIHPHHASETLKNLKTEKLKNKLKELAQNPRVVAIGECGLDYHSYEHSGIADPKIQKEIFLAQLEVAQKLNLPVIFHCRDARQEMLQLIKLSIKGVFHCFSGNEEFLKKVLGLGFYVGFDGNLTFKNAPKLQEIAKITPGDRILLETDCPFLSPEPLRGLRNTPANVKIIAEFLAKLLDVSFTQICQKTTQNAQEVFTQIR